MRYPTGEKKKIAKLLRLSRNANRTFSVLVGYGYWQHKGCGWIGFHSTRYHKYQIPAMHNLRHSMAFSYGANSSVHKHGAALSEKSREIGKQLDE